MKTISKIYPDSYAHSIEYHKEKSFLGYDGYFVIPFEDFNQRKVCKGADALVEYLKGSLKVEFKNSTNYEETAAMLAEDFYTLIDSVNIDTFVKGKDQLVKALISSDVYNDVVNAKVTIEEAKELFIARHYVGVEDEEVPVKREKRDVLVDLNENNIQSREFERLLEQLAEPVDLEYMEEETLRRIGEIEDYYAGLEYDEQTEVEEDDMDAFDYEDDHDGDDGYGDDEDEDSIG